MAAKGNEIEELYRAYRDKLFYYINGKVSSPDDAEDILSEVFIKVTRFYDSYDDSKSSVQTWLYSIARNAVVDFYRRSKEFGELSEEIPLDSKIEEEYLEEEMLDELASALESMDTELRDIIILRYYNNKSLTEISEMMDISYGRIKLLHQKALAELKKKL